MEYSDGFAEFEPGPSESASRPLSGLVAGHADDDVLDIGLDIQVYRAPLLNEVQVTTSSACPAVQRLPWGEGWLLRWGHRGTCG